MSCPKCTGLTVRPLGGTDAQQTCVDCGNYGAARKPTDAQLFIASLPGRPRHYGDKNTDERARGACGLYGAATTDPERVNCKLCFRTKRWRES